MRRPPERAAEGSSVPQVFVLRIISAHNPRLRAAAGLLASARARRKAGRCVLEGEHLVTTYIDRIGLPEALVISEDALARPDVRALADRCARQVMVVPVALFASLAALPAGVGVIAVIATPDPAPAAPSNLCVLLEDMQDPGNVGSILRSAAAAGAAQVLLSPHCAFAWSPKVLRAAQGAHFQLAIRESVDLVAWVRTFAAGGGTAAALVAAGGTSLFEADLAGPVALAIGNEGAGLSEGLSAAAGLRLTIPMPGGSESLNAAAAAAVCLFEVVRQRAAKPGRF